jgi:uncharacterized protein YneF (UPF0154 family)
MNELNEVKKKYIGITVFSIFACTGLMMFGGYWIPAKVTQEIMLENPTFNGGINQGLLEAENKIKEGALIFQDNIPLRYRTDNADVTIIKMTDEEKVIPYTKYRIEIRYRYPNSIFARKTKLDAILVAPKTAEKHVFADLFWSLE